MSGAPDQHLLEALLDSWDRNNAILLNLLHVLPGGGLEAKAIESSPSVAELFTRADAERPWIWSSRPAVLQALAAGTASRWFFAHCWSDEIRPSLVESTGLSEPLPVAWPRLGRRTALTFPLFPPPQKN